MPPMDVTHMLRRTSITIHICSHHVSMNCTALLAYAGVHKHARKLINPPRLQQTINRRYRGSDAVCGLLLHGMAAESPVGVGWISSAGVGVKESGEWKRSRDGIDGSVGQHSIRSERVWVDVHKGQLNGEHVGDIDSFGRNICGTGRALHMHTLRTYASSDLQPPGGRRGARGTRRMARSC